MGKMGYNWAKASLGKRDENSARAAIPAWKRALDWILICCFSPVLLVPMLALGLFIKLVSRGPLFFAQQRIGYHGRPFTCWKFRTMHAASDHSAHESYAQSLIQSGNVPMQKLDLSGDPRVIRCGGLIRASGLDELPQLLNVLLGEMSLVGPRPCVPYEYEQYTSEQRRRFDTLPGLTGLWQVNGKNHTTFSEMIALDLEYVRRRSLSLDVSILARTLPAIALQISELVARKLSALHVIIRDARDLN